MGTIILNAKTGVVNFIKYLIQRRGKYSRRVSFIVLSLLLFIPFQNCSQGTFKIEETDSSSVSNNSVNEPSNTAETVGTPTNNPPGTIAPVAPTEPTAPTGPVGPSAAQIQAEIERKNRCKGWLQTPMIMNADVVKAKVFNLKAGLAVGSGDIDDASSLDVIVDDNKGVNPKVDPADGCTYETRLQVSLSMDAGKVSQFNSGIDASGAPITIDNDVNGQRVTDRLGAAVEPRANNNNLNNGGATYANSNISLRFRNRQANMGTRAIRCADGVAYYKLFIRVSTTNLNTVKVGYASTNMANVSLESEPIYVQTNIENNCWKEQKLNNAIASEDSTKLPATNAKFGTSVAMDGDFAAALSEGEDDLGYIYLFKKNLKGNWSFVQKILPGNPIGSNLTSVALKGNLLAVSSMGNQGFSGRVYVYSISSGLASLVQTIKNPVTCSYPTTPCSRFGSSLALTGSSVIVGDVTAQVKGAVYLYAYNAELFGDGSTSDRTPTSTLLGTILSSNDAFNDLQALGANLVFQGGRAVVAAYQGANSYKGSIHIFNVDAGTFVNVASINSPSIISDKGKFGSSISFDGTSLAVGAVDDSRPGQIARGAMIYYQNYTDVTNPFIIFGAGADEIRFGVSLAMVGDSVYVGTRGNSSSGGSISRHTKANLNARNASVSFLQLDHYSENGESFSYSMSVSEGASKPTIIVGAQTKPQVVSPSEIRSNAGAVYIYEIK
ncbi:MAG: hypothetical protein J0M15_14455 [Deltaproteobacteria bacterium]|nr:hypothetical protein [Deltaproteobacteria bacterium]